MHRKLLLALMVLVLGAISGCDSGARLFKSLTNRGAEAPAEEQQEPLARVDTSLRDAFLAMDKIMLEVYGEFAADVAGTWGAEEMKMPTQKLWVSYDEGLKSRIVMDFEQGELIVEQLLEPDEDEGEAIGSLQAMMEKAVKETPADLTKDDQMMHHAVQMAKVQGVEVPEPPPAEPEEPVLQDIVPAEAAGMVSAATVTRKAIVGDDGQARTMLSFRVPFTEGFFATLAARYADYVIQQAQTHDISPSLILAIIQIESAFNPRAMSPVPAYGLMQLVPRTGALDAYLFLHGGQRLLDPEFLYQPGNNVKLGVAYLKLLNSRYLRQVEDPQSRLYCVIAAYNTGAGNVARAFTGNTSVRAAAPLINQLAPEQVFAHLRSQLPFEETRRYIVKVRQARDNYRAWDEAWREPTDLALGQR